MTRISVNPPLSNSLSLARVGAIPDRMDNSNQINFFINTTAFSFLFIGYFLTTGTEIIQSDLIKIGFRLFSLTLFLLAIIFNKIVQLKHLLILCILTTFFIINQSNVAINAIYLIIIIMSLHRQSQKQVSISLTIPVLMTVILHLALLNVGVLDSSSILIGERTRSALGFTNANQASAIYLSFSILALFTHQIVATKTSLTLMLASFLVGFFITGMTDSRTTMAAMFLVLALKSFEYLFLWMKTYKFMIRVVAAGALLIASVITYFITFSNSKELNIFLSSRPYFFSEFLRSVAPFEFIFGWSTNDGLSVDNLFLMLLSGFGLFGSILIILSISFRIYHTSFKYIAIIITMISTSVFEAFLIRPEIPISILFLYLLLTKELKNDKGTLHF